jgi:hypothetical protein
MAYHSQLRSARSIFAGIIESKNTEYRGVLMRSRLEADFARHLDDMGANWTYEPAIYGPRGKGYLPDFQIERPDGYHFIEVKPTLAEVPLAKKRMEIIWNTHPDAVLIVACAAGCRWFACERGQEWTSWIDRWKHQAAA